MRGQAAHTDIREILANNAVKDEAMDTCFMFKVMRAVHCVDWNHHKKKRRQLATRLAANMDVTEDGVITLGGSRRWAALEVVSAATRQYNT